jgi:hypothetical protein
MSRRILKIRNNPQQKSKGTVPFDFLKKYGGDYPRRIPIYMNPF